jgi:sigma-E factor negative regulatory protein RseB
MNPLRVTALAVGLLWWTTSFAVDTDTESAHAWLMKIARAARTLDYQGSFVYQHGSQLDAMRIIHKVIDGKPRERLVSLNGSAREIVRDVREVRCYYPDQNYVVVENRRADNQDFPMILPERVQDLLENYVIELGRQGRVAGRTTQLVLIKPRDGYRYGYQLWADRETGLLLKTDLVDQKGELLEQFMFTELELGSGVPVSALEPQSARPGMIWHRDTSERSKTASQVDWVATQLPKGFKLSFQLKREMPTRRKSVEHLVYSDGLSAVSVFIEKQENAGEQVLHGESRMGAVSVYGAEIDGHRITTVGEVPLATVALIGGSVARRE